MSEHGNRESTKQLMIGAIVAIVALISIPWAISSYCTNSIKYLTEGGYEQSTLQGTGGAYWVKKAKETETPTEPVGVAEVSGVVVP